MVLLFGMLVCLIPQSIVDKLQWKPKTRLGRAADVSIVVSICMVVLAGLATQAHAATPSGASGASGAAAEHVPAGMGMGKSGGGYAAMNRPQNDTELRAMKELECPCGCARQSINDCDCATAAQLRAKVQAILAGADLSSDASRKAAYDQVLGAVHQGLRREGAAHAAQ